MNKQALAFLTMFSLVLMLSVYYVTLPADSTAVMKEDSTQGTKTAKEKDATKKKEVDKKEKNTSDSTAASALQESINQKKDTEINKHSEVVGDTKSEEASKKEALATIDVLKNELSDQQKVQEALRKEGYETAVEMNGTSCIVSVFEQKDDQTIAKKVMQKTSELTNNKYFVEVTFK